MKRLIASVSVVILFLAGCKSSTSPTPDSNVASISGVVRDGSTNAAIPGMNVSLFSSDSILLRSTTSDAGGNYKFDSVAPGSYFVVAGDDNIYQLQVKSASVTSGASVTVSFSLVAVPPVPTLHVIVLNATNGKPLNGATVRFSGSAGTVSIETYAGGNASYNMGTGTLQIEATDTGFQDTSFSLTWDGSSSVFDTVQLQPIQLLFLYRFSGNSSDSSGLNRPTTLSNAVYTADRFGNARSALQFNGTTTYLTIPDAPDLNFGKTGTFSICFWGLYSFPQVQGTNAYVVRKATGNESTLTGYELSASNYSFGLGVGTTYGNTGMGNEEYGGDTRWHFLVFTFSRDSMSFYFDGVLRDQVANYGTSAQGNMNVAASMLIGGDGTAAHSFKGTLDDIRMYRGVLDAAEINVLYHENGW